DMAAHMFAFYFGVVSDITPPTALAAVTAAGIARSHPVTTMNQASRIGVAAFIVPFMFVYSPGLLAEGSIIDILRASVSAGVGLACLAAALTGFAWRDLAWWERLSLIGACILLIADQWLLDLAGLLLAAVLVTPQWLASRRQCAHQPDSDWSAEERKQVNEWMARETLPSPAHDLAHLGAWAAMAVVASVMGTMGHFAWHSREIALWLAGLGVCTLILVGTIDLTRHLSSLQRSESLE
ncbi:MAG: TRAP transporter large permease subunit, partial [Betaproteobacteria bacterium]